MPRLFPLLAFAATLAVQPAAALDIAPYSAAAFSQQQQAGKPVALHFHADWCPTCLAQDKVFSGFKDDPLLQPVTLLVVDYDRERELKRQLGVRTQSTVIVYRGNKETARVAGVTDSAKLRAALASALR